MASKIISKLFNLRSKWLTMFLIGLVVSFIFIMGYLKFYNIDSQHDQLEQLYTENKSLKAQLIKVENNYKILNNSISALQTQMTHGVILDSSPKGILQVKSNKEPLNPPPSKNPPQLENILPKPPQLE